ncbi:MAG: ATP-binding protein, partial [Syntrophales bacterium LBB04]|nr:ATP-binding protein [Syntrophales bacterium LBB04]
MLAFARKQTIAPKALDLNESISGALNLLNRIIGEDINIHWHAEPDLWKVKMDPSQMDQILANLCVNARDAISGVGNLTIAARNQVLDKHFVSVRAGMTPGEYVMLTVSDDGCGMDKETQGRIFEPFFT